MAAGLYFSYLQAAMSRPVLQVKTEVFDHGVFPCPARLTPTSLLSTIKALFPASTLDCKITLQQWLDTATRVLALTPAEAEVYYEVFRAIGSDKKLPTVDLKQFGLYLALQLLSTASIRLSVENAGSLSSKFNSDGPGHLSLSGGLSNTVPSPVASPRGKAVRGFLSPQTSSEFSVVQHFVKGSLKLLLRLLAADIQVKEVSLTAAEFNALSFVFTTVPGSAEPLSRLTQLFNSKNPAIKASGEDLADWLTANTPIAAFDATLTAPGVLAISGLSRAVTVKQDKEVAGKDVRILNCEESQIFINGPVRQLLLLNCRDVTCFVAAVGRICTMDKCENCVLTAASAVVRIGNSVDCTAHLYSVLPPALYGDNRSLTLGPMNAHYPEMIKHLERAGLPLGTTVPKCVHNWSTPVEMSAEPSAHCYQLMQPKDFFTIVLPRDLEGQGLSPVLTPEEFVDAIRIRGEHFATVQNLIARARLNEDQERLLHQAVQGYFREYLVSSGRIKGPVDLVKMMDQGFND